MVPGGQTILGQVVARHLPRIESRDIATGHFSQMGENTQGYFFFSKQTEPNEQLNPNNKRCAMCSVCILIFKPHWYPQTGNQPNLMFKKKSVQLFFFQSTYLNCFLQQLTHPKRNYFNGCRCFAFLYMIILR
jgi:hypothetical protein